jgi:serine phosphatase RsbU (regulator of sigma subunit)
MEDQLNAREEDYSRLRLMRMLKKHGAEHPAAIAKAMFADLDAYRDGTPITDDQSIVIMRVI